MENSNSYEIKTTKLMNGETAAYTLTYAISLLALFALKQILKVFFGLSASISVLSAFIVAQILSFVLEKRFVFAKCTLSSGIKQILMFIFRGAVDFGLYKLSETLFGEILDLQVSFCWSACIAVCFVFNYYFDRLLVFDCAYKAQSVRYSRIYKAFYANRFIVFAVFLAAVCICFIYGVYTVFPIGDHTVMRMDLYHQYGPLFAELYDRVINHQSFFYSWTSGGGSSFLGNYFNYLSSPLTTIIFFFDKEDISYAITTLVAVKCILSAGTFTYYIKASQKKHSFISAVFGVFYAFSAYFLAYYWNVMWLDGMILLPLIALGIEKIINSGKSSLYIASMVILFFSSYYMGFMTCIFAVIYFIAYFFISSSFGEKIDKDRTFKKKYSFKALYNNKLFNRIIRFAISSLVAGMLCAFTLIPVFLILRSSSATSDSFPKTFESYYNIFDFITSHLAGLETTIRSSGDDVLPNVYSGILAIILLPLYVSNKDIRLKEKTCYILLMLFFLFSFDNNCMNFIWHAFHFPNDLPFRFSYMYSFILLVVGFKAICKIRSFEIKDITLIGMMWVFFIIVAQKMSTTKMLETTIYTSLAFVILWTGYLCLAKKGKLHQTVISAIAVLLCFSEVLVADTQGIVITQDNTSYKRNYDSYTEAIEKIEEYDSGFYREELCYLETRMDPCYYGYNGISTFSSMAYEDYSQLQYSLGMFGNRINSYTYNTQTAVYNMMFNIKYLIQTDTSIEPSSNLYNYLFTTDDGNTSVYENKYFLPISYCVNENVDSWDTEKGNPFDVQGDFFELAAGYSSVFKEVKYIETNYENIYGEDIQNNGTYWFYNDSDSSYGYADITVTPEKSGNVYIYVTSPDITTIEVSSDKQTSHTQQIEEPYILDIGYYEAGEEITVSLDCGSADSSECYADIYIYTIDEDVLSAGYQKLSDSALDITEYSDTSITGTLSVDENSYLYSSIPYDSGWTIYIDGEEAETFEIGDAMLGTVIKAGSHTVEYKYTPNGLVIGIVISGITAVGVCGYAVYYFKFARRRKEEILSC